MNSSVSKILWPDLLYEVLTKYNLISHSVSKFALRYLLLANPMAETPRHGDIVADKENIQRTIFV